MLWPLVWSHYPDQVVDVVAASLLYLDQVVDVVAASLPYLDEVVDVVAVSLISLSRPSNGCGGR